MNRVMWIGLVAFLVVGLVAVAVSGPGEEKFTVSVEPLECEEVAGRLICSDGPTGKQTVCLDLTSDMVMCTNEVETARDLLRNTTG
jgi:hypothetical protein